MRKEYFILLISMMFVASCQHIAAAKNKKAADHRTDEKSSTIEQRSPVTIASSGSTQYQPSDLLLKIDFEKEEVRPLKGKEGSYDKLVVKTRHGNTAAVGIMYEGGSGNDRYARIVADPANKNNQVLLYWLKHGRVPDQGKGKYKGRIQLNLADLDKTEIFERVRLYLHPDLTYYSKYPEQNGWFGISTLWMGERWKGHPYPFKISLNIAKPEGVDAPLYFLVGGSTSAGGEIKRGKWKTTWSQVGANFPIPVGEWLDIEIGYKSGDKSSGRFYMGVKREKEDKYTTVFDITDWTYHPGSPEPVPLTSWQPMKLYTSSRILDFIRDKGGVAQIYWDDFEAYGDW